jgi:hypothetical protein
MDICLFAFCQMSKTSEKALAGSPCVICEKVSPTPNRCATCPNMVHHWCIIKRVQEPVFGQVKICYSCAKTNNTLLRCSTCDTAPARSDLPLVLTNGEYHCKACIDARMELDDDVEADPEAKVDSAAIDDNNQYDSKVESVEVEFTSLVDDEQGSQEHTSGSHGVVPTAHGKGTHLLLS